jgi:hypothetical protein
MPRKSILDGMVAKRYEFMGLASLSQANPVSGTKYLVLDTTKNCRINDIAVWDTWTVQPNPLEVHITIDGESLTFTQANPVTATAYYPIISALVALNAQPMGGTHLDHRPFFLEGRSIKVEAEITGGTSNPLDCRVIYSKIP